MPALRAHQEIATSVKQGESSVEDGEELPAVSHFHRQNRKSLPSPSSQAFRKEEACSMEILTKTLGWQEEVKEHAKIAQKTAKHLYIMGGDKRFVPNSDTTEKDEVCQILCFH